MTTIAGIETPEGVILCGDSLVKSEDLTGFHATFDKVWRKGELVLGFAGTIRTGQSLKYYGTLDTVPTVAYVEEWLATDFAEDMRGAMETGGRSLDTEWGLLIGVRNELWLIDDALGVTRCVDGFNALGSGANHALGSFWTTTCINIDGQLTITPEARVAIAMRAAMRYALTTGGELNFVNNYPPEADIIPFPERTLNAVPPTTEA